MKHFYLPLVLLPLWQVGLVWSSRSPRLNVTDEHVVFASQGYFSLRCEGTKELHWNWTTLLSQDDTDIVSITHANHPNTDYPYVSSLTIRDPLTSDTGFYYCHYSDATNYATDVDNVARTYIYVHDGENGLVSGDRVDHIKVTTAEKLVIDCRPTLPNITVQLWKDSAEISSQFEWDPRIGFVRRNLVIQLVGLYLCKTENGDEKHVYVDISPSSASLPKPAIKNEVNQHYVQGSGFRLSCSLMYSKKVRFSWVLPRESVVHNITLPASVINPGETQTSILYVHNATLSDSGAYTCKVTASGTESNQETIQINIQESLEPFINITGSSFIKINEGQLLKWRTDIRAYPADPEIIYRDWNGLEIKETPRVTTEFHAGAGVSWLRIKNVTANDFGNYSVEGISGSKRDSATLVVQVKSKPSAVFEGAPSFVMVGHKLEISCEAKGFPLPTIKWTFKACLDGQQNCPGSFTDLQVEDLEDSTLEPGNIRRVKIVHHLQESGILSCDTENEFGVFNETIGVSISDIGGTFVFRHQGEDETNNIVSGTTIDVVVNDNFFILCGATKFDYKNVHLTFLESDPQIHRNETKFSRLDYIREEKVTTDLKGTYICKAEYYDDTPPKEIRTMIVVHDEELVKFTEDANMNIEGGRVEVEENKPFNLSCSVSGTPRPTITWFKDDEPLTPDSPFFDETTLLAKNHEKIEMKYIFKEKHVGWYSCRAENRLGELVGSLTIVVPRSGLSNAAKVGLSLACMGIAFLVVVVVVLVRRVKQERKFRKSFRKNELYLFEKGNIGQLNPDCTADEQAELLPYSQEWEVPRENIRIGKQLGSGAFGRVVKATVSGLEEDGVPINTAALKMCKSQADQSQVRALALELKIMIHLGKHLNIVNLLGANTVHIGKGELWILVEYCRFGNLLVFMQRHRKCFINQIDPSTDHIDHLKLVMDPTSPLSPISHSTREGVHTAPITDHDGYLAPSSKFNLEAPPLKRRTDSPPQSPASLTASSSESYRPDGHPRQQVHNPMYTAGLMRSVSDCPEGDPRTSSSSTGGSQISHRKATREQSEGSSSLSDNGSVGYRKEGMQTVNTYLATAQSVRSPLSPSPLSPTDSSHISDMGLDSQGNPFLYEVGSIPAVNAPFSTSDLVCWAWQVAQGMEYLTRRKVLHGDLAARNLLLADDNVVKISDFGLSREMYKKDVYMKKGDDLMPIKWMSVEAIRDRIFSVQSDVWAYGVTLWELFSLGSVPYPGIEVNKDFLQLLEGGYRMNKPKYANQAIYDLLLHCWDADPKNRPSFSRAAEHLGILMLPDIKVQYMTMNDPYLRRNEERFQNETDYLNMLSSPDFENLQRDDDETRALYVNVQDASYESRDNNYLNMKSPDLVGYSRASMTSDTRQSSENPLIASNPHYLPMNSARGSPSPMNDVFSPRPNEATRFTFAQKQDNPSTLTDLPEEEEHIPVDPCNSTDDLCTENSSLINNGSIERLGDLSAHSNHSSINQIPKEEANSVNLNENKSEVLYLNLPSLNSDH
ncbi:vascular endothelial growth factor receptor 1-like isoform X2 [Panulirus ornatus]|uniref:vascular endothelial growth factor receptor 1-like isoform X2 n=1 Tax=Panulirus ornatus TaxID=150431 RepID=UPI003A86411D